MGRDGRLPVGLPNSKGRLSTRAGAATGGDGALWLAWPTDNRTSSAPHQQQIYAGWIASAATAGTVRLQPPSDGSPALSRAAFGDEANDIAKGWLKPVRNPPDPPHADEQGDIRRLRSYRTEIDGSACRILRGDFHRHTELSWDEGGNHDGSLQDFYRYMLDAASLDFGASTDHNGGAWPYSWWYSLKMTDMYNVPGAYTAIFGYERSVANPWGHRNVFFARRADVILTPLFAKRGADPGHLANQVVSNHTRLLYEAIRSKNPGHYPHTSGTGVMGTDWADNDPTLEPVVEIFQGATAGYEQEGAPLVGRQPQDAGLLKRAGYNPDGMVSKAWTKGYRLGVIASSDHFSTHISYAFVYTADTSRQGILDAIRRRHTYGATDNIMLEVRMGRHFMGDEFQLSRPEAIVVKARGARSRLPASTSSGMVPFSHSTQPNRQEYRIGLHG